MKFKKLNALKGEIKTFNKKLAELTDEELAQVTGGVVPLAIRATRIIEKEFFIMKSKEELNAIKEEAEALNRKLAELTEEELAQVSGGFVLPDGRKHDGELPGDTQDSYVE